MATTMPKWQQPLAERAGRADQTLRAVLLAPGAGAGGLAAAAAADRDLAELCKEFAERTNSPLLRQLLINGGRALAAEAEFLLEAARDDLDDDVVNLVVVQVPALAGDPVDERQTEAERAEFAQSLADTADATVVHRGAVYEPTSVVADEDQALVEPAPAPAESSDDAAANESAQASLDDEAQAIRDIVFPSGPEHWEIGIDEVVDRVEQVRTDVEHWRARDGSNPAYERQCGLDAVAGLDRCLERLTALRADLVAELVDAADPARADPDPIEGAR